MHPLIIPFIFLIAGLIVIYFSADNFTENSAKIANIYKISPLLIGIVILGFGTSAPEMLVSGWAAFKEHPGLSVGNAFGSNIFNIALVLGITAIISPIKVELKNIKFEWVSLIVFTFFAGFLLLTEFKIAPPLGVRLTLDSNLNTFDGILLLLALGIFLINTIRISKKDRHKFYTPSLNEDTEKKWKLWRDLVWWLFVLILCAQCIVFGATNIATVFGVPDVIIGITIVALGTSLPELAVSISSAFKNQHEMVVGNIIGSNIFNTVAVLAIPALISTSDIPLISTSNAPGIWPTYSSFFIDFGFMLALTIGIGFFLFYSFSGKRKHQITDKEGILFILILCVYLLQLTFMSIK